MEKFEADNLKNLISIKECYLIEEIDLFCSSKFTHKLHYIVGG